MTLSLPAFVFFGLVCFALGMVAAVAIMRKEKPEPISQHEGDRL